MMSMLPTAGILRRRVMASNEVFGFDDENCRIVYTDCTGNPTQYARAIANIFGIPIALLKSEYNLHLKPGDKLIVISINDFSVWFYNGPDLLNKKKFFKFEEWTVITDDSPSL